MNIAIVGTGYVGLVSGTCFAEMGVNVTCVDVNEEKIRSLQEGKVPIYEPGLDEMVLRNQREGRLHFTTDLTSCLDDVEVVFSAVGTPPDEDGSADLHYVLEVARTVGRNMNKYLVLVTKSTVPVGTAKKVKAAIQEELDKRGVDIPFDVASNPEFLKEGAAIKDFMSPDRVVVGVESDRAKELMTRLYRPFLLNNFRVIFTDIPSAEMIKLDAGHPHILYERHREPLRIGRCGREHGAQRHRFGYANRQQVPLSGLRIRRQLFPKGCEGADKDGGKEWIRDASLEGRRRGERASEDGL